MLKLIISSITLAALAGCAAPSLPTNSDPTANFDVDKWACQQAVAKMERAAPAPAPARPVKYTTSCTTIGMNTECDSEPSDRTPSWLAASAAGFQLGQSLNDQAMPNCMRAKGWK